MKILTKILAITILATPFMYGMEQKKQSLLARFFACHSAKQKKPETVSNAHVTALSQKPPQPTSDCRLVAPIERKAPASPQKNEAHKTTIRRSQSKKAVVEMASPRSDASTQ